TIFTSFHLQCSPTHRHLHSFPTRRSSDLASVVRKTPHLKEMKTIKDKHKTYSYKTMKSPVGRLKLVASERGLAAILWENDDPKRSEEHTSELQSPCNLVCRLLLEKKKKKI